MLMTEGLPLTCICCCKWKYIPHVNFCIEDVQMVWHEIFINWWMWVVWCFCSIYQNQTSTVDWFLLKVLSWLPQSTVWLESHDGDFIYFHKWIGCMPAGKLFNTWLLSLQASPNFIHHFSYQNSGGSAGLGFKFTDYCEETFSLNFYEHNFYNLFFKFYSISEQCAYTVRSGFSIIP